MSDFYCRICGIRPVSREGEICNSCQDPYDPAVFSSANNGYGQSSSGSSFNTDGGAEQSDAGNYYQPVRKPVRQIINNPVPQRQTGARSIRSIRSNPSTPVIQQQTSIQQPVSSGQLHVAPPAQIATVQNQAGTQTDSSKSEPITEGIVKNLTEGKDPNGKLTRWMRSLILGIPYARTDDITEFQVYANWTGTATSSGFSADKVIAYGNISYGKPVQDNSVRVYGVRDKNRVIIARDIQNTTDGVYAVFNPKPLSASAVRIITLLVAAIIGFLFYSLISGAQGLGNGISRAAVRSDVSLGKSIEKIIAAVIVGVIALISGKRTIENFGRNWKGCGICALITLFCGSACISLVSQIF